MTHGIPKATHLPKPAIAMNMNAKPSQEAMCSKDLRLTIASPGEHATCLKCARAIVRPKWRQWWIRLRALGYQWDQPGVCGELPPGVIDTRYKCVKMGNHAHHKTAGGWEW